MLRQRKTLTYVLYAALVVALVMLAATLSSLEFAPGRPFRLAVGGEAAATIPIVIRGWNVPPQVIQLVLFFFFGVIAPLSLIHALLSKGIWRQIMRDLVILVLSAATILVIIRSGRLAPPQNTNSPPLSAFGEAAVVAPSSLVTDPPTWLISLIIVTLLALVGVAWFLWQRRRPSTLARLAEEAQQALDDLAAGNDLGDTILRCYNEMSRILAEAQRLQRDQAMTAREFEARLASAGLADASVQRLTRLFESARYSQHEATDAERQEAIACLGAITLSWQPQA